MLWAISGTECLRISDGELLGDCQSLRLEKDIIRHSCEDRVNCRTLLRCLFAG
jgi:hypothetical protein